MECAVGLTVGGAVEMQLILFYCYNKSIRYLGDLDPKSGSEVKGQNRFCD